MWEIKELECSNNELQVEIDILKESHDFEIQNYKDQIKNTFEEMQEIRRKNIHNSSENNLREEITVLLEENEKLRDDLSRLEIYLANSKTQWVDENVFLQSELNMAEKVAIDAKIQFAQVSTDKDYYQFKYKELLKGSKKRSNNLFNFIARNK